jgi:hypothetical protein
LDEPEWPRGQVSHCETTPSTPVWVGVQSNLQASLLKEASHMSIQSHLADLEQRHEALENEIAEAMAHPSTDDLTIAQLKRRKLQVKDEIERLRQDAPTVH